MITPDAYVEQKAHEIKLCIEDIQDTFVNTQAYFESQLSRARKERDEADAYLENFGREIRLDQH